MLKQLQKLKRQNEGFTIIEVLIVLAIAGLIMVVVFLAVPALQRSGRNNALNTDANNIFTGVNNYVSNNNGTLPTAVSLSGGTVTISGATGSNPETVKVDSSVQSVAIDTSGNALSTDTAGAVQIETGSHAKCNDTASGLTTGGTGRSVAVTYIAESGAGNITKCLN